MVILLTDFFKLCSTMSLPVACGMGVGVAVAVAVGVHAREEE